MAIEMSDIRFKIAAARRIMAKAGLDPVDIAGQVTAREGDTIYTTPMRLFAVTKASDVVATPLAGAFDQRQVTSANRWVQAIYRARPDVNCVIHTHAPYIGAVAATGQLIDLYNNRSVIFWGEQALYDDDGTATDSPEGNVAALGDKSVLIQRNHGAVVVAGSVEIATAQAVLLEAAARFQVLAQSIGGKPFPPGDHFAERARAHRANLDLVWQAHLEALGDEIEEIAG
jgi:L-fuculose-phosphate aldolase